MKLKVIIASLAIFAATGVLAKTINTDIFTAIKNNDRQQVAALIKENPDIVFTHDGDMSPLHIAVEKGRVKIAKLLINHGADVNDTSGKSGSGSLSPLYFAHDAKMAKLLIQHGAKVNAIDEHGDTPLHSANLEVARILIKHGANIHAIDTWGNTPLHTSYDNIKKAKLLIEKYGADVTAKNNKGETPLEHAKQWIVYFDSPEFKKLNEKIKEHRKPERARTLETIKYLEQYSK